MSNKNVMLGVAGGVAIAAGIIAWLYSGSADPITIKGNNGVTVQARTSMKDTVITRDKDGEKLWEFHVDVVEKDKKLNKAYLKGIKGKVFRKDGSHIDVTADSGEATLDKANNNFMVAGNVKAIISSGGELYANKVSYIEKTKQLKGQGKVKIHKDDYTAYGDYAETTTEFEKFKLKGHAKVEKGGKFDDK